MPSLPFLCEVLLIANLDTEVDESEHGEVHKDALNQQRSLKVISKPENDSERVSHEQSKADVEREALCGLFSLYL